MLQPHALITCALVKFPTGQLHNAQALLLMAKVDAKAIATAAARFVHAHI
jgi:hypothetical protein